MLSCSVVSTRKGTTCGRIRSCLSSARNSRDLKRCIYPRSSIPACYSGCSPRLCSTQNRCSRPKAFNNVTSVSAYSLSASAASMNTTCSQLPTTLYAKLLPAKKRSSQKPKRRVRARQSSLSLSRQSLAKVQKGPVRLRKAYRPTITATPLLPLSAISLSTRRLNYSSPTLHGSTHCNVSTTPTFSTSGCASTSSAPSASPTVRTDTTQSRMPSTISIHGFAS